MPVKAKIISENENPEDSAAADARSLLRILVAEDDDDVRRLTTAILGSAGYMVDEAQDGEEAWEAVKGSTYDLILTDYNMPRMTGLDLLNKLHSAQLNIPAILVTGHIPSDELLRNSWLQIEAMLLKPFTPAQLLATVENVFNGREFTETPGTFKSSGQPVESPHHPRKPGPAH